MLRRKGLLLIVCPVVLVPGFYLFLICANYYYTNRAQYLLQRIRSLRLDNSSITELKQMGSKFGFRYEETPPDKCIDVPCLHYVFTNNHWMHLPLRAPALAAFGERLGLRSWFAAGEVEIQNGQVIGKIYGIQFYSGSDYPDINISAWHEHKLQIDRCSYYPLKRHPGYGFRNASNIRSFTALVSDDASQENRDHAFQFNLKCLTRRTKCKDFSELIPAAWADFEEDNRWSMTHEDNLVWQIGKPCPF